MLLKIRSAARGISFPSWSVPIALLALTLLSYGLRARSLGFYWDDWPYLWYFHRFGPDGIRAAFTADRPFLSFIYNLSLSLFGSSAQGWQAFALLARWLCSLGLWWALTQAWPRHAHKTAWAAFLFAVYPGFTQQWIAIIYGQAFILFAALFFSIGVTLRMARKALEGKLSHAERTLGTLLALALSGFTMFSTEYFFGLELLRPVLLWILLANALPALPGEQRPLLLRRAAKTAAWWAPYLVLMLVFVFWRGVIHVFPAADLSAIGEAGLSPLGTLWGLGLTILEDLIEAALVAWGKPLQLAGLFETGPSAGLRLLGVMAFTGVMAAFYLARLCPAPRSPDALSTSVEDRWAGQAALAGLFALLVAGWPFWITRLPMRMSFPQDRYTLPLAVGVSLLLAGLVDGFGKNNPRKAATLGLVVALAAGFHFTHALSYREDWNEMRSFFWQLSWRAPSVEPGTLFLLESLPLHYYEDDSLTAPLNWMYDPDGQTREMDYLLVDLQIRRPSLPDLEPGQIFSKDFRAATFNGSTSQVILVSYAPSGCVKVLDPVYDSELANLPNRLHLVLPLSTPGQLVRESSTPAQPPVDIFGAEPKHRWCYYFEKASLARQQQDWQALVDLKRQSIGEGLRPEDPSEYLPFIEGLARAGSPYDAYQLTMDAYQASPSLRLSLCAAWQRAAQDGPANLPVELLGQVNTTINCPGSLPPK